MRLPDQEVKAVRESVFVGITGGVSRRHTRKPGVPFLQVVVVDVAIDQGGCFETSKPTTHEDPTYVVDGVLHYCVANMPGAVPLTSSHALNNATLGYGLMLANEGLGALRRDPHLREGLNVHKGKVTYKAVADALGVDFTDAQKALD